MNDNTRLKFVFFLNFINILIITAAGFMMPLWSKFVVQIGGDVQTAGNAIGIFSIIIGFFTFVAGKLESKFDNDEFFMVLGQIIMIASYTGYFFVKNPIQLYAVQVGLGVAGAIQAPAIYSLYAKYMPKHSNTFFWGIWTGFYNISIGIGAFISAYIVHHFGFHAMFSALVGVAVFGLVSAYYTLLKVRQTKGLLVS